MWIQTPPAGLMSLLEREAIAGDDLRIALATDVDLLGRYQTQWLLVTDERVLVATEADGEPRLLQDLRFADVTEFRCQSVVGSGLLQTRVGELWVDLLRYSNALADPFNKIARKLDRHLKGQPIEFLPGEEVDPNRCPSCGLMLMAVGDTCPRCVSKGAVLVRMWKLMSEYRGAAAAMLALLIFGIGLDLVAPQLTRYLVDEVLPGEPVAVRELQSKPEVLEHNLGLLMGVVGILALVQVLRTLVNVVNGTLGVRIGTAITFDMRSRLVRHLHKLSVGYYDRQQVGSLVGRVAYDTDALHGFVMQLTSGFIFQLIMVVGVGIMMFNLNAKLAFWTLIPAPLVIFGSVLFWRYIYPRYYRFWDASSKQAGMLSGVLSGVRVVKIFGQEEREIGRFNSASDRLRATRRNVDTSTAIFNPFMSLIFQVGGWIVWFVGGYDVIHGQMTLGSLMAFLAYLAMFYGPLTTLTQFTNWLTQFATQAHRIFEILDTPVDIVEARKPIGLGQVRGHIQFEKVTFGYQRHSPVLWDVDLEIQPGEMIGVVGRSGSGKTTIVNLISRFYDAEEGCVRIDGFDVRDVAKEELRSKIGVVLQEPFLFRGSIWENLIYGLPTASPEQVIAAAKAANAHDFVLRRPHGYDTWVGEHGAGLSGGERQRAGIARVLLTDPRILILDEATSSVDAESEAAIQAALAEVVKGRTTIAIAHRLSTLRNADRILVVDQGRIIEQGSHQELVALDGLYARLVRIQGQQTMPSVEDLSEADKQTRENGPAIAGAPNGIPHLRSHHARWLTPDNSRIHIGSLGALHVTIPDEHIYGGVYALRCLPVNYPDRYISLRYRDHDNREVEIGLVHDMADWGEQARRLVNDALLKRYLVHTITAIHRIEHIGGYLHIAVDTDLGPKEFMMRWQSHRAVDYGADGKMLMDTEENRYLVRAVNELPTRERDLFQRYVYW